MKTQRRFNRVFRRKSTEALWRRYMDLDIAARRAYETGEDDSLALAGTYEVEKKLRKRGELPKRALGGNP